MQIYFCLAVLLMIIGHMCKTLRWKQLIKTYEDVRYAELLQILAVGHGINLMIPYRLGDIIRIYLSGRKLKNGYALSIATVIADIYVDALTVGLAFLTLYILRIHTQEIEGVVFGYVTLSIVLLVATILIVALKKYVKKIIQILASVFNKRIELGILHTVYSILAIIKNSFRQTNFFRLFVQTFFMWAAYFSSYNVFAICMQRLDYPFTLTSVFKTVFSMNGTNLYGVWIAGSRGYHWTGIFMSYMGLPLLIIFVCTLIVKTFFLKPTDMHARRVLPQLNENERLAFLEIYFRNEEKREYINQYLNINKDINVIRDYSAGSNATTILCLDGRGTFFRKYAFGSEAIKLRKQIAWIKTYKNILPLPNIIAENMGNDQETDLCYYDMEYNPHAIGFFSFIHSAPTEESWMILEGILTRLKNSIHSNIKGKADKETISAYIESKVKNNIDICCSGGKYLKALQEYAVLKINGEEYPNLMAYEQMLGKTNLEKIFSNDDYAVIHGDLTVENIICLQGKAENQFYLIDPNAGNLHESPYLDYSKLLQSLHGGYEFLMSVQEIEIVDNQINFLFTQSQAYHSLYMRYQGWLESNFSLQEIQSIYYHEIIHYLRLMPYKIKKDSKKAVVFYAGLLIILKDIKEMFESVN